MMEQMQHKSNGLWGLASIMIALLALASFF